MMRAPADSQVFRICKFLVHVPVGVYVGTRNVEIRNPCEVTFN